MKYIKGSDQTYVAEFMQLENKTLATEAAASALVRLTGKYKDQSLAMRSHDPKVLKFLTGVKAHLSAENLLCKLKVVEVSY